MKIIFDLRKVGLGNNGGSSTLVKSGNTLVDMGHEVTFVDTGRNQHTWSKLKAEHKIVKNKFQLPKADFIIATGYKSVSETTTAPYSAGVHCHWIRGWETWQYPEKQIVKKILNQSTLKLVNGECLQRKLAKYGVQSHLIRPGYDFDLFTTKHIREQNEKIIIGGLNKQGRHANTKRTSWILETAKSLKKAYKGKVELWMFGLDNLPVTSVVDKYLKNPTISEKNDFYNHIDIWLAPSMLEGLHMPPAEAMITECPVVGTDAEMSGTIDYLIDGETGIVTKNDPVSFVKGVKSLVENKDLRIKFGKNARNKILQIGNRRMNMQKLIDLFTTLKGGH
jgi:glycosyltransferase involved in cell wall biosynthesis